MSTLILNVVVGLFAIAVTTVLTRKVLKTRKEEKKAVKETDLPHQAFVIYTRNKAASR